MLVADDLVFVSRRGNDVLIGKGHELQRHFMEIRGVGLVDIKALFGIRSVRQEMNVPGGAKIKLVVVGAGEETGIRVALGVPVGELLE